ncbi:hypothetical protein ACYULU_11135 [Breznakiellaceae bacterium SP9]
MKYRVPSIQYAGGTVYAARYAVPCYRETTLETGFINNVIASSRRALYFVFALSNFQEQSIITESRRALQFLYDAKNRPGLAGNLDHQQG